MHLVLINQYYPPDLAPTGWMLEAVAEEVVRAGHRVTVLCAAGEGYAGQDAGAEGRRSKVEGGNPEEKPESKGALSPAAAVAFENHLDEFADVLVGLLRRGGLGGVVVAAAGHSQDVTDRADAVAGGLADVVNHFAELGWGLVPRMTAAFFKMSFS